MKRKRGIYMMKRLNKEIFRIVAGIMIMTMIVTTTMAIENGMTLPVEQLSATDPDGGNIASGQTIMGTIDPISDMDTFSFYGKAGQVIIMQMAPIDSLSPRADLYDPDNIFEKGSNGLIEDYQLKKTGIYKIVASGMYGSTGKYALSLILIPWASSSKQDSDGGDIVPDHVYQGNISTKYDRDMFVFYGKKDDVIIIEMVGNIWADIALYNSNRTETRKYNWHNVRIENYPLKQTGIYTIVTSTRYGSTGKYNLSFLKMPSTVHGINNTNPSDKSIVTDLNQYFKWGIEGNIAAKYDIYFGEDVITPLNKIGNNITLRELKFPTMQYGKTYYWHVEAKTPTGTIQGPYWWFTTKNPVVIGCNQSAIYGYKFNDANNNKTKDSGEVGISNWVMNLKGYDTCTGKLVSRTTTTNNTGYYRFGTINAGTYIVYENFVLGWLPTTGAAYTVTVPSKSTNIKRDFGNKK
jgi:hypothetical protein